MLVVVMRNPPPLSVVVPAHSRIDLYMKTIASLQAQTLPDFELIVTDDSWSAEDRKAIEQEVARYRQQTGRTARYLFTAPGLGQARNTNQGLRAATGDLIRILHSDDILHPQCLSWECRKFRELAPLTLLFQDCIPFRHDEDIVWDPDPLVSLVEPYRFFEEHLSASTALPSGTVFRREALASVGGMREDWSFLCDWELFANILLLCGKKNEVVAHAAAGLFGWRLHKASTTSTRWRDHFVEHKALMREWKDSLPGRHQGLLEDGDVRDAFFARGESYRQQRLFHDCEQLGWREYLASVPWLIKNRCLWPAGVRPKRKAFSHLLRRLRGKKPKEGASSGGGRRPAADEGAWVPDLTISPFHGDEGATPNKVVYVKAFDNRLNLWPMRDRIGEARRIRINHVCLNRLFGRSLHECLKHVRPGTEVEFFFHDNEHMTWFGLKAAISRHAPGRFAFIAQNRPPQEGTALGRSLWTIRYRCLKSAAKWHLDPITGITVGVLTRGERIRELNALVQTARRHCPFPLEFIVVSSGPISMPESGPEMRLMRCDEHDDFGWITRKKNIICQEAKYSDVVVCHDRFEFSEDFFEAFGRWGHGYGIATPKVVLEDGRRGLDWPVVIGPNHAWSEGGLLRYRDYSEHSYAPGGVTLIRKSFWMDFPWAEDLFWNEHEDVELSRRVQRAGEFIYLFPGKMVTHHDRWVDQNPLLPFLSLGS